MWGDSFDEAMHRFSDVVTILRKAVEYVQLTIACAMIGRYLAHLGEYILEKDLVKNLARADLRHSKRGRL